MDQQNQNQDQNPTVNEQDQQHGTPGAFSTLSDPPEEKVRKHSGLGIASFVIAVIGIVLAVVAWTSLNSGLEQLENSGFNFEEFVEMSQEEQLEHAEQFSGLFLGILLFLGTGFFMFIGLILGIISLFQDRKKLYPILGTVINGLPIVIFIFLMMLGLTVGNLNG